MSISHKIAIDASRDRIFSVYENIEAWPKWDGEVEQVYLPEGIRTGSTGWLKPTKGLKINIRVTEVVPKETFLLEGALPLCRMVFGHYLQSDANRIIVTHTVSFSGPLAFLFRRVIGTGLDARSPNTLAGLKRTSEQISNPSAAGPL